MKCWGKALGLCFRGYFLEAEAETVKKLWTSIQRVLVMVVYSKRRVYFVYCLSICPSKCHLKTIEVEKYKGNVMCPFILKIVIE